MALWLSIDRPAVDAHGAGRSIVVFSVTLPLLVAFARFYRGAHHVSDIVVGALLGIFCAVTAVRAVRETRHAPHEEAARR